MRVSIVIPSFNGEQWIKKAVENALAQDFSEDYEVIVRDDGSTDGTVDQLKTIKDSRLRIVEGENCGGIGASFQAALECANTEFVTVMGQDDFIDRDYLTRVMAEFKDDIAMVGCHPRFVDGNWEVWKEPQDDRWNVPKPVNMTKEEWLRVFHQGNMYFGINTYRRQSVLDVGGFDVKAGWLLDLDLYIRLVQNYSIHVIEEELCSLQLRTDTTSYIVGDKLIQQHQYDIYVREKNFKPKKMKVILATPFYMSQENANFGESMIHTTRMLTLAGIDWDLIRINGDSYVDRAKNTIVANFLETDGTDLIMIDSDESWSPVAISRLLQHPEDIVAGAYPFKNNWGKFAGNPKIEVTNGIAHHTGRELSDGSVLLEAYNVAGGFLRIKRDALVKYAQAYPNDIYRDEFAWPTSPNRIYTCYFICDIKDFFRYGEDAYFSRRMQEAGIKLWIDPNIHIAHHGMHTWTGNLHESLLRPPEEVEKVRAMIEANKVAP